MSSIMPNSQPNGPFQPRRLLIFGATGLIGSHVLRALLDANSEFDEIRVFTSEETVKTKAVTIDRIEKDGATIFIGNLEDDEDIRRGYNGIDVVISCVGRNMIAAQVNLIRLAAESPSVQWFFPSEYGTDIEYNEDSAKEIPHQKKLKVRAAIHEYQASLKYTYVVTGPYANGDAGLYLSSNLGAEKTGSFDVKNRKATLIGDGNLKIGLTTMQDVGKLVLAAIRHPEISQNRAIKVNSFYTTDAQILASFERQTGGIPWDVTYTSLGQLRALEEEAWSSGQALATLITLRRIWSSGGTIYDETDNQLIGASSGMNTLDEAIRDAIQAQKESQHVHRKLT